MQTTDIFLWHDGYHGVMETKDNKKPIPLAYIITCRTYATGLHGDKRKSVDPKHNELGTLSIKYDSDLQNTMFLFRAIQYTLEEQGKERAFYGDPSYHEVIERV